MPLTAMAPTYAEEDPNVAEKKGEDAKGSLTSEEAEAASANLPPEVRRAYALKIWGLLGFQMLTTWVIACVVEAVVPWDHNPARRVIIWCASALIVFFALGILRINRARVPCNYIILAISIPLMGAFWGLTKYVIQDQFSINLTGIVTLSLLLSAVLHKIGITDKLGLKLAPKKKAAPPKKKPELQRNNSRLGKASKAGSSIVANLKRDNDGLMRATILLGMMTWAFSWCVCLGIVAALEKVPVKGKMIIANHVDIKSAALAGFIAGFLCAFFHWDAERQMRKCNLDDYMEVIVNVNTDIFVAFVLIYGMAAMLACNDQAAEMNMGGGGDGGGGGADMGGDVGAMEGGGAEADVANVDGVIGGGGV